MTVTAAVGWVVAVFNGVAVVVLGNVAVRWRLRVLDITARYCAHLAQCQSTESPPEFTTGMRQESEIRDAATQVPRDVGQRRTGEPPG